MTRLKIAFFIFKWVHKILLWDFYYINFTYKGKMYNENLPNDH